MFIPVLLIIIILILLFGAQSVKAATSNIFTMIFSILIILLAVSFITSVISTSLDDIRAGNWFNVIFRLVFFALLILIPLLIWKSKHGKRNNGFRLGKYTHELMEAVKTNNLGRVNSLLLNKVNPDFKNDMGWTPLLVATSSGYIHIVKSLLEAGADPNIRNKYGDTALMYSKLYNYSEITNILKSYNAIDYPIPSSSMILISCILNNNTDGAIRCLEAGLNPNSKSQANEPALILGIKFKNVKIVKALLEAGADPNANGNFETPDMKLVTKALSDIGIDPHSQFHDESALKLAQKYVNEDSGYSKQASTQILKLLKSYGAN